MDIVLAIIFGVVCGVVIGFVLAKLRNQSNQTLVEKLQFQLENEKKNAKQNALLFQKQIYDAKAEGKEQVELVKKDFEKRLAEVKSDADKQAKEMLAVQERGHAQAMKDQQARFDEMMAKVTEQLKTATDEMLKQRQKEFTESSNTNLGQIVAPLRETIDKMKQTMSESTLKQTELSAEMKANLENMIKHSAEAKQSADELARVFKHKSKVQGNWGERVLEELLESQGLQCGIHYERESVIRDKDGNVVKTDTGGNLRPDVILHLDTNREVIIDSKVSLTAFMDYINAETEEQRQTYLKQHIDSIQKHVKELSKKDYSSYIQKPKLKMEYVIMFVPHTGALWTALNAQPNLWRSAMEQNVFIADEQTLFAALKMINLTWSQIKQAENHERVYDLANEMLNRVGLFLKSFNEMGKNLEKANASYTDAKKKLLPQGQSIVNTCDKLEQLGAKQNPKNPITRFDETECADV